MKPKVTIVIACYNSGKTIRCALQSVKVQTFRDWECLVVDGASRDDTINIVQEFAHEDTRFRYISEPDKGIYDAFNKGWRNAIGKWVYYLGSDDIIEKDGIQILMEEEEDSYAILSGNTRLIRLDGSTRIVKPGLPKFGIHQGMVMRRDIMKELEGFDEKYKILADYDLMVRIINAGYKMKVVDSIVGNFVVGGTSQSISGQWKYFLERYEIDKKYQLLHHPLIEAAGTVVKKTMSLLFTGIKKRIQKNAYDNSKRN